MHNDKHEGPMVQLMACWVHTKPEFLNDEKLLRELINEFVRKLEMTVLIPTLAVRVPTVNYIDPLTNQVPKGTDFGLTMFTVISESHIAIHTWPKYGKAWLEIVSCKPFKDETVRAIVFKFLPNCIVEVKHASSN